MDIHTTRDGDWLRHTTVNINKYILP